MNLISVPGKDMQHPLAVQASQRFSGPLVHRTDVSAMAVCHMDQVEFYRDHDSRGGRPFLNIAGSVRALVFEEPVEDIAEVTFALGEGQRVMGRYDFTRDQLVALAGAGGFESAVQVPESIVDVEYEVPVALDLLILTPEAEDEVPVVFSDVRDRHALVLDQDRTEYDLMAAIVEHHLQRDGIEDQVEIPGPQAEDQTEYDEGYSVERDMFADVPLVPSGGVIEDPVVTTPEPVDSDEDLNAPLLGDDEDERNRQGSDQVEPGRESTDQRTSFQVMLDQMRRREAEDAAENEGLDLDEIDTSGGTDAVEQALQASRARREAQRQAQLRDQREAQRQDEDLDLSL